MNKSKISSKYNKITQQKKFHLLTLVLKQKMLIKQAAKIVGINYSTAKTIIFFNRNQGKSYQFDIQANQNLENGPANSRVNVRELSQNILCDDNYRHLHNFIEVICTIGIKNNKKQRENNCLQKQNRQNLQNSLATHQINNNQKQNSNFLTLYNATNYKRLTRAQSALLKQKKQEQDMLKGEQQNNNMNNLIFD